MNLPSHGHGQGYTDLNFVIPELVERVEYRKGPYYADEGNFSAAGAAHIEYLGSLPEALVKLDYGEDDYGRLLLADSRRWAGGSLLGAVELGQNDGPWTSSSSKTAGCSWAVAPSDAGRASGANGRSSTWSASTCAAT